MSYVRTTEHRALRAKLIQSWKPWEKSTGAKTPEGKAAKVAMNALKHGNRSKAVIDELESIRKILSEFEQIYHAEKWKF